MQHATNLICCQCGAYSSWEITLLLAVILNSTVFRFEMYLFCQDMVVLLFSPCSKTTTQTFFLSTNFVLTFSFCWLAFQLSFVTFFFPSSSSPLVSLTAVFINSSHLRIKTTLPRTQRLSMSIILCVYPKVIAKLLHSLKGGNEPCLFLLCYSLHHGPICFLLLLLHSQK